MLLFEYAKNKGVDQLSIRAGWPTPLIFAAEKIEQVYKNYKHVAGLIHFADCFVSGLIVFSRRGSNVNFFYTLKMLLHYGSI